MRRGAEIDRQDKNGSTALKHAACFNRPAVVLRLLRAGADMTLRDAYGKTALQWAKEQGHPECVQAFRTHLGVVATNEPEQGAVGRSRRRRRGGGCEYRGLCFERRGRRGGSAEQRRGGARGGRASSSARQRGGGAGVARRRRVGRRDVRVRLFGPPYGRRNAADARNGEGPRGATEALLQRGADVSLKSSDDDTALTFAAVNGREKLIELALRHGAEINGRNGNHCLTALMGAASKGHEKVVDTLIRHGAAIDLQSNNGATALIQAAFYGRPAALLRLLRAGADVTLCNTSGWTALQFAKHKGHAECMRALREHAAAEKAAEKAAAEKAVPRAAAARAAAERARPRAGAGVLWFLPQNACGFCPCTFFAFLHYVAYRTCHGI